MVKDRRGTKPLFYFSKSPKGMSKERSPKPEKGARVFLSVLALSASLGGCGPVKNSQLPETPLPSPSPVVEENPIPLPSFVKEIVTSSPALTPTLIETASPWPTLTPTPTPAETITPLPSKTPTLSPTPTETPVVTPGAEIIADRLNVRGGPGTNYEVVNGLNRGMRVAVLGQAENGWFKVSWEDEQGKQHEGWISGHPSYANANEKVGEVPLLTGEAIPPTPTPRPTQMPAPTSAPTEAPKPTPETTPTPEESSQGILGAKITNFEVGYAGEGCPDYGNSIAYWQESCRSIIEIYSSSPEAAPGGGITGVEIRENGVLISWQANVHGEGAFVEYPFSVWKELPNLQLLMEVSNPEQAKEAFACYWALNEPIVLLNGRRLLTWR